jgi:hypothetical protein
LCLSRAQAWNAYKAFFETALESTVALPPVWVHDIFSDLVYLYQQFHELRAGGPLDDDDDGARAACCVRRPPPLPPQPPPRRRPPLARRALPPRAGDSPPVALGAATEAEVSAAWRLPDVLSLLHAQVERSGVGAVLAGGGNPSGLGQLSGYFALVCLSRFLTKLGDYGGALDALRPLKIFSTDGTTYGRIPKAHISVQYYAAFALMMARAYEDAFRVLHRALALFQRLHNVLGDRDREPSGGAHVQKTAEKMLALLALCVAVLPSASVDEIVRRPLRERFAEPMERVTAGDAAEVEALFAMAAPGYF